MGINAFKDHSEQEGGKPFTVFGREAVRLDTDRIQFVDDPSPITLQVESKYTIKEITPDPVTGALRYHAEDTSDPKNHLFYIMKKTDKGYDLYRSKTDYFTAQNTLHQRDCLGGGSPITDNVERAQIHIRNRQEVVRNVNRSRQAADLTVAGGMRAVRRVTQRVTRGIARLLGLKK